MKGRASSKPSAMVCARLLWATVSGCCSRRSAASASSVAPDGRTSASRSASSRTSGTCPTARRGSRAAGSRCGTSWVLDVRRDDRDAGDRARQGRPGLAARGQRAVRVRFPTRASIPATASRQLLATSWQAVPSSAHYGPTQCPAEPRARSPMSRRSSCSGAPTTTAPTRRGSASTMVTKPWSEAHKSRVDRSASSGILQAGGSPAGGSRATRLAMPSPDLTSCPLRQLE